MYFEKGNPYAKIEQPYREIVERAFSLGECLGMHKSWRDPDYGEGFMAGIAFRLTELLYDHAQLTERSNRQ